MTRRSRLGVVRSLVAGSVAVAAMPAGVHARSVVVSPGPGTPLGDAIAGARPGDVITLADGVYSEAVVIDKPLGFRTAQPWNVAQVVIDAGCSVPTAVTVASNDVWWRLGGVTIRGGTESAVDVLGTSGFIVHRFRAERTCPATRFGLRIDAATRAKVNRFDVDGFVEAGVLVAHLPEQARMTVAHGFARHCGRGVLAEDDLSGLLLKDIEITDSEIAGIELRDTAAVKVKINRINGKLDGSTAVGIWAGPGSTGSLLLGNEIAGHVADVADDGTSNCWKGNTFTSGTIDPNTCR